MSDFFGKLKSGAGKVAFEAEKMNRLNRAKGELEQIKKQIDARYMKLGELYYQQHATMGVTGPAYDELCQAIVDLERQIAGKNEDIQRISADAYAAPGAGQPMAAAPVTFVPPAAPAPIQPEPSPVPPAPSLKYCPNCGKEMAATVKFCPDCGTKV